jgi:hypothetical protein
MDGKVARERRRLVQELRDDTGLEGLTPVEIEELAFACRPPVHERQAPPYGAIVTRSRRRPKPTGASPVDRAGQGEAVGRRDTPFSDLELARLFADGRFSFLVRPLKRGPRIRVFSRALGDELSLTRLADAGASVIQRTSDGRVRLYRRARIYTREFGRWWSKPTATTYLGPVLQHLGDGRARTAQALLELCVHHLSPANVGATIVWNLGGDQLGHLDEVVAKTAPPMDVNDRESHPAIRAALSQFDRAALLDRSGTLTVLNVSLDVPPPPTLRDQHWGTRHQSALSFSKAEPKSAVFVVSQDGPVSVFYRGEAIATTAEARWIEADWADCPQCQPLRVPRDFDSSGGDAEPDDEPSLVPVDPTCEVCGGTGVVEYEFTRTGPYE